MLTSSSHPAVTRMHPDSTPGRGSFVRASGAVQITEEARFAGIPAYAFGESGR